MPSSQITASSNAAARLVVQESRFCHITPLLKSLHWLPVKYRIVFKILLITFKAIHGLAPAYISELISVRDATGRHNLRSNNGLRLNHSSCKSILGDPGEVSRGRAKWRDESYQERAEEPLGTKSHRTISKRLCE